MNRIVQWLNFVGILTLAALCAQQWRVNGVLHLQVNDLEKTRLRQLDEISDRDNSIKGLTADLEEFRARLTLAESQMKELEVKLSATIRDLNRLSAERDRLVLERDQLKTAVDQWAAAVKERDAAIKQAAEQATKLIQDRNDAVMKFNDLVGKYNALVKDYTAATRPAR